MRWFFHATAMVRDYEAAREALTRLVGLRVLEDTWIEEPIIGRRGGLTWIGDNSLELGQPIVPGAGTDVYVSRFGPGMQIVAVQVADMAATLDHLEQVGSRTLPGGPQLAFTHPKETDGVFIEWFTAELPFDPRFGSEIPPYASPSVLDVQRMAYVGAVVRDPVATAHRIAELMATELTFVSEDAGFSLPTAGVSLADNTLALFALPDGEACQRLWGTVHADPRSHCLGLQVPDLDDAAAALADCGIGLVRRDELGLVLPPAATGMVPLVITDRLLPGDPRSSRAGR